MKNVITKTDIISSLFWKFIERVGTQGISFLVQITLARLLEPKHFGIISLITIFISIANIFVQSGFNTALIQKKNVKDIDYSSVFYFSLFIALILYLILFILSPLIAKFYGYLELIPIIRVLSVTLFIGAINSIQNAIISKKMQFKKLFNSSLIAIIVSGVFGVLFAYNGFGVWALVYQQIINQLLVTLVLFFTVKWRPKLLFSFNRLKILLNYGWKILFTNLLGNVFLNIRSLLIGKIYNAEMLGFYNRGMQFPNIIVNNIDGSIQSVMLPSYAAQQDNREVVKNMVRRSVKTSSFIVFPIMIVMAAVAKPLVSIILTEKWLPTVPFLQIYCIIFALMPIHTSNIQAIKALGYSGILLKLEIVKKMIDIFTLLITIPLGIYAIAIGELLTSLLSTFINSYPNKKFINYSFFEQWRDIFPTLLLSLIMGILVYCINYFGLDYWITLTIQILLGFVIYISLAILFRIESLVYLLNTILSMFGRTPRNNNIK